MKIPARLIACAALSACVFASASPSAHAAAVLFDQAAANTSYLGTRSAIYNEVGPSSSGRAVYDDFVLASDASLTRIEWTGGIVPSGVYSGIDADGASAVDFAVGLYADNGGEPDNGAGPFETLVAGFTTVTGSALPAGSRSARGFRYGVDLGTSINLTAGTRYWLGITALFDTSAFDVPSGSSVWEWHWTDGSSAPPALANGFYFDATASQLFSTSSATFTLIGDAATRLPEPTTLPLLVLCLASYAAIRGRRHSVR